MSEITLFIVAVIVAAVLGYSLARARSRESVNGQGRLTLDAQRPPNAQPTTITTKVTGTLPTTSSAIADAVESALEKLPDIEAAAERSGVHVSIKTNVTRMFKLPSKEAADAVAERERAKGMSVIVTPPDATDQTWRVNSTKHDESAP